MSLPERLAGFQSAANHSVFGNAMALVGAIGSPVGAMAGFPTSTRTGAIVALIVAAFSKEFYDWATGQGTPSWKDFLGTIAGGLPTILVAQG